MSIDNLDDTSDSPIQFGLADKSLKVLQEHSRRLEAMVSAVKGTLSPGAGGQFSGKFLQVAQQQLIVQKDIAHGMRQLNVSMANMSQLMKMQKQMRAITTAQSAKVIGDVWMAKMIKGLDPGKRSKGGQIWDFIKGLPGMIVGGIRKGFSAIGKIWESTGGKLFKKTGQMGLNKLIGLGGVTIIGALVGKMISSSPLLQAMFKILNTSLTLIMRPIGDFFGAFFRPMFIYFLKEVAIPFFQAGRGWMKEGEKWGRIAVGFFIDPVTAIGAALVKSFSVISGWLLKALIPGYKGEGFGREIDPATGEYRSVGKLAEAEFFHKDPAAWLRWQEGITGGGAPWTQAGELFEEMGGLSPTAKAEIAKLDEIIDELEHQTEVIETGSGITVAGGRHVAIKYGVSYPYGETTVGGKTVDKDYLSNIGGNTELQILQMEKAMIERIELNAAAQLAGDTSVFVPSFPGNFITPLSDPNMFNPKDWEGRKPYGLQDVSGDYFAATGGTRKWDPNNPAGLPGAENNSLWWKAIAKMVMGFGVISPGASAEMEPGTTLEEINANIEDFNNQSQEQVEDTKESFTRIAYDTKHIQDLIEDSSNYQKNISSQIFGTMSTVDLYNKRIESTWGVTSEQMDLYSNQYIKDLFELSLVFHQMKLRGEEISLNDELRANALLLGNDIRLKEIDRMVDTSKHIGSNLDMITTELDRALRDFIGYQHLNQTIARITFNELAIGANTLLRLLGSESKILTDPDTPKSFDVASASSYGRQWLEKNVPGGNWGGAGSAGGAVYSLMENAGSPNENAYAAGVEGPLLGGMNEFSYWLGPKGEFSRSGVGVNKGVLGENAWTQVADYETAAKVAEAYKNQSLAAIANEIRSKQQSLVNQLTGNQAAIYLAAGGGTAGLEAARIAGSGGNIPGVNTTGPSFGHWSVSQDANSPLGQAIAASKEANPGAWESALGFSVGGNTSGGGGGGGGGGWSNKSTASGGVSSASPGYSGPGAQFGGIIDEPIVGIGMHSGREWRLGESGAELVTPLNQIQGGGGLGNIIINIGNITREADYMKLKPLIQRWILEASSRRGMV